MGDVLEEADESGYWIELLSESGKVDEKTAAPLLSEANELVAISIVAFLALSVNFLQLVSGWTGKTRGAVEWLFHRLRPWRFLRIGVRRLLLMEPVKF